MNPVAWRSSFALISRRGVASSRSFISRSSGQVDRPKALSQLATAVQPRPSFQDSVSSRFPRMAKAFGNFDLLTEFEIDSSHTVVSKWQSRSTGLSIVHLDYEAPIVKGYFTVRTEIFNDSGCPHTLEHLVFMGSKKYPYKGIIDHLANRGFSNGTNAWTDIDHTAYTVQTAGDQGFLQLLPIYVDHILFPTMKDAAYVTEVHHIDPTGADSGVVYSEMQGIENTSSNLIDIRKKQLVNPEGSAYRSEFGGLMGALRKLSVDQIRDYHGKYYVPHNLTLIVGGTFQGGTESLLRVIQEEIEPSLIDAGFDKGPHPPGWKRPFLETASAHRPPFQSQTEIVEFPEKDESMGEAMFVFKGPPSDDSLSRKALDIVSLYLTSSSVAPLNKEFIEREDPLCTYIVFEEEARPNYCDLPVYVGSVPTAHLDSFGQKLHDSLVKITEDGFDMTRMRMVIDRDQRQLHSKFESSKGDTFSADVIEDAILGPEDGSGLKSSMNMMPLYAILRNWTDQDWRSLLKQYYIDSPCVTIRGKPSARLADKIEDDEKARLAAQVEQLGSEGLAKKKKLLDDSKAENDAPIPTEVLTDFPVPSVSSISWIPVQSYHDRSDLEPQINGLKRQSNSQLRSHIESDGNKLPFFVQFDHVESDFISVSAVMSLSTLPDHLRPLASTYMSAFFSLPVKTSSGERLSHEELVAKLDAETVHYDIDQGVLGSFTETFRVSIEVEKENYEQALRWLKDLIFGSEFDIARLQTTCAKILQGLPELKRDGNGIMLAYNQELLTNESSTTRASTLLAQMKVIPELVERLRTEPEKVRADFEEFRKHVTDASGLRFSVTGNVLALPAPRTSWSKYFGDKLAKEVHLKPIITSDQKLSEVGRNPSKKAVVVGLPTIESSFTIHSAKAIQGFKHPEAPALRIAIEVLSATESYLWRVVRGSGLAYGAYMSFDLEAGLLNFSLYRSSNALKAFEEAAKVVRGLVDGTVDFEDTTLDSAKSTIVFNVAKTVSKPGDAAAMSFINQALKQVSQNHGRELLEKYQAVTKDEVLAMMKKYILPVFDPSASVGVIVSAPGKVDETIKGLEGLGFEVEKREVEVSPEELMELENSETDSDGSDAESELGNVDHLGSALSRLAETR